MTNRASLARSQISEATRYAVALHRWPVDPDFVEEGEAHLTTTPTRGEVLLTASLAVHRWIGLASEAAATIELLRAPDRA